MWSTRTSATRRRSSVRSGWTIPPEDGAARETQRVVQALSSSPSGPAGSVGREAPQDGPQPFNLAPGVRGCGPAPTSAMVPFDRVFPTRSYGGLTAVPGSCAAARTRRTNFASRVSRGTSFPALSRVRNASRTSTTSPMPICCVPHAITGTRAVPSVSVNCAVVGAVRISTTPGNARSMATALRSRFQANPPRYGIDA